MGQEAFAGGQAEKNRLYGTSERLGGQQFAGGQADLQRALQEKLAGQDLQFNRERLQSQIQQAGYNREDEADTARAERRAGLTSALIGTGGVLPALGGVLPALGPAGLAIGAGALLAKPAAKLVKKIFCFRPGTLVVMADDSLKPIEEINLGEETKGGRVLSTRQSLSENLFGYCGIYVTGTHAVKENDRWIRVQDSGLAIPVFGKEHLVYSLVTTNHRIFVNGTEFADETESDQYEWLDLDEALAYLNKEEAKKLNSDWKHLKEAV